MHTSSAPIEIGRVALTVNDIAKVSQFYETVLGLATISGDGETRTLGAGGRVLLELRSDPAARARSPREAGLFHTAFLLPGRADLGAWILHAAEKRAPIQGASDHIVSEAIYLADPEGNGIEVYADRPREGWTGPDGKLHMATEPLDLKALAADAEAPWAGAPEETVVGHVHLQVGSVPEAESFYAGMLGIPVTTHYPGAAFYGSGGYHHHLATNIWNSRGAGPRNYPSTGLSDLELLADAAEHARILTRVGDGSISDPWGTSVTLTKKAA
ncbi:VOC family protein [Ostreiculturibacter nitratireducens]|uniref:VOC family protein n=1 Tax=Ostreiculturibacter nitratireducens TaxID=3075226 RepID=UPI0031B5B51E